MELMLQSVMRTDECHVAPAGPKLASGAFSRVEGSTVPGSTTRRYIFIILNLPFKGKMLFMTFA